MRPLLAALALLLLAALPARAQLQDEVDEVEADLRQAEEILDAAQRRRAVALGDLTTAVARWRSLNAELEALAFAEADMRDRVAVVEGEARGLRRSAEQAAVDAYMAGGSRALLEAVLAADDLHQVVAVQVVVDQVQRRQVADLAAVEEQLDDASALRAELDELGREMAVREAAALTVIDELDILFATADAAVLTAHAEVESADAEYQEVYALLQEAIRLRRLAGPGVDRWRSLVAHYFPEDMVDQALEVMYCESRGNPQATHPVSGAAGLFQFMEGTWSFVSPQAGFAGASRYEPEANIAGAAWLVDFSIRTGHRNGAWGRWTCQPLSSG